MGLIARQGHGLLHNPPKQIFYPQRHFYMSTKVGQGICVFCVCVCVYVCVCLCVLDVVCLCMCVCVYVEYKLLGRCSSGIFLGPSCILESSL